MKNPIIAIFALFAITICGCGSSSAPGNGQNANTASSSPSSTNNGSSSQPATVVNVDNRGDCENYLKGKSFYGGNSKIEFTMDGNVSISNKQTGELVFAGNLQMAERYGNASRKLKLTDATGGGGVLKLVLGSDGKLMDETDLTIYMP